MANIPVISFNTGEVSPKIDVRSDIDKYRSSCRRNLLLFVPEFQGQVKALLRSIHFTLKAREDTSNLFHPMPDSFSDRWTSRISIRLRDFLQLYQLSRKQ